jgi:hypothetical protein
MAALAELRQAFLDAQRRRMTAYAAYPMPVSSWPSHALRELMEARSQREASMTNYAARRKAERTWETTLARARSESFTAYFEEVRLIDQACEAIEVLTGAGPEGRLARIQWIAAWKEEILAMNAYAAAQDGARVPATAGQALGRNPASQRWP